MNDPRNSLRSIQEVPLPFRSIFSEYPCFNVVQSEVFNDVLYSDQSLVVSSPTGSGKTAIFELAIVKLLMQLENNEDEQNLFKIIYISPIKSLCQERLVDWHKKFSPFGLKTVSVTGDSDTMDLESLANNNLILSTPEKWDSLTRRWRDNEKVVEVVKLFMIDEVHLLNEENRGSTLEVIVSRMKTVENSLSSCNKKGRQRIRFLALSATIPNVKDIAEWVGKPPNVKFFRFSEDVRPVKLKKIVLGYNYNSKTMTPFKFDLSLNYKLHFLMVQHSEGKPTLIFCSTRKSVEMTAKHLVQSLKICLNPVQIQKLYDVANMISDVKVRDTIKHGVGYHHAGLIPETRHAIEEVFRKGELPVLVTTSTLAMGVNLPAHLVIIKSTKCYDKCGFQDYTEIAIHQMIGRAGRPQFDTSATVLILTSNEDKEKFEKMVGCNQPIESNLHRHLTEHLNAEVVLRTITDLDVAMQWLASTFLYVRARKNPHHYGLSVTLKKEQIDKKLLGNVKTAFSQRCPDESEEIESLIFFEAKEPTVICSFLVIFTISIHKVEMCQIDLNKLVSAGMICMNQDIIITPTRTGELMAKYYVAFETMKLFTQITGTEILMQILALISKCHEFSELRLRVNDKKALNLLNKNSSKDTIRFPLNGKIKSGDMKVNCIIQAVLGNLDITDHSILSDSFTIMRNGNRIVKCLTDYLATKGKHFYSALLYSIILGKCFHAKLWENSLFVSKQLSGIGSVLSTQLVNAGKTSFDKILQANPRDIEMIVKKRPPMGDYLIEEVQHIPKYNMTLEKVFGHKCIKLKLTIQLMNLDYLQEKSTISLKSAMSLLVGNNLNEILIYERYQHSYLIEHPQMTKSFEAAITPGLENIEAHFISEDWVGIDCYSNILFSSSTEKTEILSEKSTKKQETKQSSYIQMFLDMYMKIKKKPTKEKQTKKEGKQTKKGEKIPEKQKNDELENAVNVKSTSDGNIEAQNIETLENDNKYKKGYTERNIKTKKIEAVEKVNCDIIVQKVADKHLGFQFMNNNEDIIRKCLGFDENSKSASDTDDIECYETFEYVQEEPKEVQRNGHSIHESFRKEAIEQNENEKCNIKKDKFPNIPSKENKLEINTLEEESKEVQRNGHSIHESFRKEAIKQNENEKCNIKKDKLPNMPSKENKLEINTLEEEPKEVQCTGHSIHESFRKEAIKQNENVKCNIKKDKLPNIPSKENKLEINTLENCIFTNDVVEEFFSDAMLDEGQSTDQMKISQSNRHQLSFASEIEPKNTGKDDNVEIGEEQSEDKDEGTNLSFHFPVENEPSSSSTQKYKQKINRIVDYSHHKYMSHNTQNHPRDSEVHSRSIIRKLSCPKDQRLGIVYHPEDLSKDNIYNEEEKKNEHEIHVIDLHESCNSQNDDDIEGVCDSVSESRSKKDSGSYCNTEMQQRTSNCHEQISKSNKKSGHTNSEIQSKIPDLSIDFDSILKNDPSIFAIGQKYASDRYMQEKNKSFDTSYNQFPNKTSRISFKQNAQRKCLSQWLSRPKKKQKREWEDIHPAEQFEDKLYREKANLDNFRKPEKKKISNYSEIDSYPDSTVTNQMFTMTEMLDPVRKEKVYGFEEVGERMDTEKEIQKSIKWRSPLVMSPAIKFSPKINFSSQFSKENDFEVMNNMSNETMNTSLSSRNAANSTVNTQKTSKQPKNSQNIFKSSKYRGTKFPLCDNDYHESPENSKSSLDYSDICSTPFLEGLRLKEHKRSTPKRYKQCEPSTATDYYTQFVNQSIAQKEKHEEKQESSEPKPLSPSIEDREKENIPKNKDQIHSENSSNQRDFNLSQSMCESEMIREQMRNSFVDPRVSQNRPLVYDQPMPLQSNSYRPPEFCNSISRHGCNIIHPSQGCTGYYDSPRIRLPVCPEFSVNASQGHIAEDTRFLKLPQDYRNLFRPNETLPGYIQPMMSYNAPNGPDIQYSRCYPRLGQYRRHDSYGPDLNYFRYSPIDRIPENHKCPQWPASSYYHNPEVCLKQEYPDSDYMQNLQAPEPYMRQERLDFDTIQNSRFTNNSQVERPSQHLGYQESPFGRKTSFEDLDKRSGEMKSLSQRNDDPYLPMKVPSRIPFDERPMIPNNEILARRNMSAQDLNKSLMRNTFYEQASEHYIPNIPCPSNGFSNSQSFGFQNHNHFNYPENSFQSQMSLPRGSDYQHFQTPNDKEYVMNKFMYSLGQ